MATKKILQNFRTWLAGSSDITNIVGGSSSSAHARIFRGQVPDETANKEYIWFQRQSERQEQLLNGNYVGPIETKLDVECVSLASSKADDLADKIKARIKTLQPGSTMGADRIIDASVEDHSDDYIPKNAQDAGFHVPAMVVTIWHTT